MAGLHLEESQYTTRISDSNDKRDSWYPNSPSGNTTVSSSSTSQSLPTGVAVPDPPGVSEGVAAADLFFFFSLPFWASGAAEAGDVACTREVSERRRGSPKLSKHSLKQW